MYSVKHLYHGVIEQSPREGNEFFCASAVVLVAAIGEQNCDDLPDWVTTHLSPSVTGPSYQTVRHME